jgi:hypothetical protein
MEDKFMDTLMSEIDADENPSMAGVSQSSEPPSGSSSESPTAFGSDDDDGLDDMVDPFFGDSKESSSSDSESVKPADGKSPSQPTLNGTTLKYTANGQEHSLDISTEEGKKKAMEALSLMTASRQALSSASRDKKKAKELESKVTELKSLEEKWNYLRQLKEDGNHSELYKAMTGEDFEAALEQHARRRLLWQQAENDPELKQRLIEKDELDKIKKEHNQLKAKQEASEKARLEQDEKHEEDMMLNLIGGQFVSVMKKFDGIDQASLANVKTMVWGGVHNELLRLLATGKYDINNPKLVKHVIEKYANTYNHYIEKQADAKVQNIIEDKKKGAKEKAQLASTDKYPKDGGLSGNADVGKMNPKELYKFLMGKK